MRAVLLSAATITLCFAQAQHQKMPARKTAPAPAAPAAKPGALKLNPKDSLQYAWIPAGSFLMGCSPGDECGDDEKPAHRVTISKGFWLGQTETTVGAYKRFVEDTNGQMPPEPKFNNRAMNAGWADDQQPIVDVSWDQAHGFCQWEGGRLPSEAEWEYAAKAGTAGPRYGEVDDIAWHAGNSGNKYLDSDAVVKSNGNSYGDVFFRNGNTIRRVGQKVPNAWQLFDMLGNVWEWTNDRYDKTYYRFGPAVDPQGPATGASRATRGGAWFYPAMIARASTRHASEQQGQGAIVGFRCVWSGREGAAQTTQAPPEDTRQPRDVGPQPARRTGDATADAIVHGVDSFMRGLAGNKDDFYGGMWVKAVQGDKLYFDGSVYGPQPGERFEIQKLVVTLKDTLGSPVEWHAVRTGDVVITEVRRDGTTIGKYTGTPITPASLKANNYRAIFN